MTERAKKLLLLYYKQSRKIKRVSGLPPLTFKAKKAGTLKDYRIYGNTENKTRSYSGAAPLSFPITDGAVSNYRVYGQTSRNLFDGEFLQGYWGYTDGMRNSTSITWITTSKLPCKPNTDYSFKSLYIGRYFGFVWFDSNGEYISSSYVSDTSSNMYVNFSSLSPVDAAYLIINIKSRYNTSTGDSFTIAPSDVTDFMLVEGSTALPYEPYGESVGDKTVNILPLSRTPITETHGDFLCKYDGLGTITLITDKDNAITDGEFVIPLIQNFTIPVSIGQGGTGCFQINNSISGIATNNIKLYYNNTQIDTWNLNELNRFNPNYTSMGNKTINSISVRINNGGTNRKITIKPAFVENVTEQVPFEPYGYRIPITNNSETANIYLDEPLTKQGDNADYIDYAEQKRYNADGTSEDVSLPALPAQSTSNSLSVGTSVQPSSVAVDVAEVVSCGDKVTDNQNVNYGKYKIPLTLTADSAETTDIYLDEPLAKSGNNADYIDYATQKRHNSDGTESSVTLPVISTLAGTNTLTVGTEVQPSSVEIKGRIKAAGGD